MMKYFGEDDLLGMMKFEDEETDCYTLQVINERHEFEVIETPTNNHHIKFLQEH